MDSFEEWCESKQLKFDGEVRFSENLSKHTYFKIGGPASQFLIPAGEEDLKLVRAYLIETSKEYFVLGKGSNLLVSDSGFEGVVVQTKKLNTTLESESNETVRIGSSVAISSLLNRATREGWGGFEFLVGVPGSIGGVVTMNAGTHLGEAVGALREVRYFDLKSDSEIQTRTIEAKDYSYRSNHYLGKDSIVYDSLWSFDQEDSSKVQQKIQDLLMRRKSTQPVEYPSCGSVFKNPKEHGLRSWQVIDQLSLRGERRGEAQISEKHPNFIVNHGNAKAADVRELIDLVKSRAREELGIQMIEEVQYLGFDATS